MTGGPKWGSQSLRALATSRGRVFHRDGNRRRARLGDGQAGLADFRVLDSPLLSRSSAHRTVTGVCRHVSILISKTQGPASLGILCIIPRRVGGGLQTHRDLICRVPAAVDFFVMPLRPPGPNPLPGRGQRWSLCALCKIIAERGMREKYQQEANPGGGGEPRVGRARSSHASVLAEQSCGNR